MAWKVKYDGRMIDLEDGEILVKSIYYKGVYIGEVDLGSFIQWQNGEISDADLIGAIDPSITVYNVLDADLGLEIWAE